MNKISYKVTKWGKFWGVKTELWWLSKFRIVYQVNFTVYNFKKIKNLLHITSITLGIIQLRFSDRIYKIYHIGIIHFTVSPILKAPSNYNFSSTLGIFSPRRWSYPSALTALISLVSDLQLTSRVKDHKKRVSDWGIPADRQHPMWEWGLLELYSPSQSTSWL